MMKCSIEWNKLSHAEWETRFAAVRRAPLLQCYQYAQALCPLHRQTARWGLIKIDGVEAGLVQIQEAAALKRLFHALMLDRGPVWFSGFGTNEHALAFFGEFNRRFPLRFGRKRRIIPEIPHDETLHNAMLAEGYKCINETGYQTIWLNLEEDLGNLRKNLKGNWRNKLNKGEKSGLYVEFDEKNNFFSELLMNYQSDRVHKGYKGPSVMTLNALAKTFQRTGQTLIGRATMDNKCVAAIMLLTHGAAATYQVGWSSQLGRKKAAHNLLLWEAVKKLKSNGIKDFDLGGTNDDGAKKVKSFKDGMGGDTVTYLGHYA